MTSHTCVVHSPCSDSMSRPVSATASGLMSRAKILAPSRANSTAVARPLPQPALTEPAPATIATLSSTRPAMMFLPPCVDRGRIIGGRAGEGDLLPAGGKSGEISSPSLVLLLSPAHHLTAPMLMLATGWSEPVWAQSAELEEAYHRQSELREQGR